MKTYNFVKLRWVMLSLSLLSIIGFWGATYLRGGFHWGIDFRAGVNQQIRIAKDISSSEASVRETLSSLAGVRVRSLPDAKGVGREYLITVGIQKEGDDEEVSQETITTTVKELLLEAFGDGKVSILSSEFIGSRFAAHLASQTLVLTFFAMVLILAYIWFRFQLNYAVSAIVAVFHDVLFLGGFIGAFQIEFSTATIAAILTIIGYSLNDTIVIFDRMRENIILIKETSFSKIVNISITQSMSRTIITSLTTLLAVLAIYFFSVGTIRLFALNLIVGVIVGTYSSIYIASTTLLVWHDAAARQLKKRLSQKEDVMRKGRTPVVRDSGAKAVEKKKPAPPKSAVAEEEATQVCPTIASPSLKQTSEEIASLTERKQKLRRKKKKKRK